jgi:hypothetical protein
MIIYAPCCQTDEDASFCANRAQIEINRSVLTFANFAVCDRLGRVTVESLAAVVTVAAGGGVATAQTDAARNTAGHLEQLHVEAAATSVAVAVADWKERTDGGKRERINQNIMSFSTHS